ncbi:hypothetical protein BT63DRAFT_464788 [Microthyrium microscopicum]|uniref:Alpha/beta-hydrolase n=1 Tax=Microthyrium microscopicum TaxID=703497 RepID=A0A6A6TYB7_9PEZI|nr:hypothetical protein BT63DRAFT_464788 [Microthyrium microscopicum]
MTRLINALCLLGVAAATPQAPAQVPPTGAAEKTAQLEMGGIYGMGYAIPASLDQVVITPAAPSATPTPAPKAAPKGILDSITAGISSWLGEIDPITLLVPTGPEYPTAKLSVKDFYSKGKGPYPAKMYGELLGNHTVYAPINPPKDLKMATLLWGNGGCTSAGTPYGLFLTDIASYGYVAIANGPPGACPPSVKDCSAGGILLKEDMSGPAYPTLRAGFSKIQNMLDAQDWVVKGGADKLGSIDKDFFMTAGSSCGGLEAYSAAYHNDKVKLIVPMNSGVIDPKKKYLLKEVKAPVVLITGGPKDVAYENAKSDYPALPAENVVINAELQSGHLGTFFGKDGGKYGDAVAALFDWVFRGDAKAKAQWTDPKSPGSLISQNWNVTMRNTDKIKVKA